MHGYCCGHFINTSRSILDPQPPSLTQVITKCSPAFKLSLPNSILIFATFPFPLHPSFNTESQGLPQQQRQSLSGSTSPVLDVSFTFLGSFHSSPIPTFHPTPLLSLCPRPEEAVGGHTGRGIRKCNPHCVTQATVPHRVPSPASAAISADLFFLTTSPLPHPGDSGGEVQSRETGSPLFEGKIAVTSGTERSRPTFTPSRSPRAKDKTGEALPPGGRPVALQAPPWIEGLWS